MFSNADVIAFLGNATALTASGIKFDFWGSYVESDGSIIWGKKINYPN